MTFDEILRDLQPDEAVRTQLLDMPLKEAVQKEPKLVEGWMRQRDYSSKQEQWQGEKRDLEQKWAADKTDAENYRGWYKTEWPGVKEKMESQAAREKELQDRIVELQQGAETDMTLDEIKEQLRKDGLLFDQNHLTEAMSKVIESEAYQKDVNRRVGAAMGIDELLYAATAHFPLRFQKEFGTDGYFPMTEFMQFARERNSFGDFTNVPEKAEKAYQEFVAGRRAQFTEDQYKKKVEQAEQEKADLQRKLDELKAKPPTPADTERGVAPVGRFEERTMQKRTAAAERGDGKLGDGSATAQGLAALRDGTLLKK